MSFIKKNKKVVLVLLVVLILAGGIFAWRTANAREEGFRLPGIFHALGGILYLIVWLLNKLVALGANFAQAILSIRDFTTAEIVKTGWPITRGLANMFFALILLVMSISTILRIESFGAKKVLPRLIIAALLINFSLLFAGVIIDFAQILTFYFVEQAAGPGGQNLSASLMNSLQINKIYDFQQDQSWWEKAKDVTWGPSSTVIIELVAAVILFAVTAFAFFALALFLIFRIVALWLLMIFAPLAWVSMAFPSGAIGSLWTQWWSTFFKWTFFAPIYAFFLYLGLSLARPGGTTQNLNIAPSQDYGTIFGSGFFSDPKVLLQYIAVIFILVGGLIVAQKFGIAGAGAVMSVGKRAGMAAGKWTGRQAGKPVGYGYDRMRAGAAAAAGGALGAIGMKTLSERLKAKSTQIKQGRAERKEHKNYEKLLHTMSDDGIRNEVESAKGVRALIAARAAKERGTLKNADTKTVSKAMETLKAFGSGKDLADLENIRPDAIEDKTAREASIQRSISSGDYKKWNDKVFEGDGGKEIMAILQDQLPAGDFISAFKGWSKQVRDKADKAMGSIFKDQPLNDQTIKSRNLYASATGKIEKAFTVEGDNGEPVVSGALAEAHIKKMTPVHIGSVSDEADLRIVGQFITNSQATAVRGELSAYQKQIIKSVAKERDEMKKIMEENPGWAS